MVAVRSLRSPPLSQQVLSLLFKAVRSVMAVIEERGPIPLHIASFTASYALLVLAYFADELQFANIPNKQSANALFDFTYKTFYCIEIFPWHVGLGMLYSLGIMGKGKHAAHMQ